jgi:hypothetical protein
MEKQEYLASSNAQSRPWHPFAPTATAESSVIALRKVIKTTAVQTARNTKEHDRSVIERRLDALDPRKAKEKERPISVGSR